MNNAVLIDERDDVVVAIEPISKGEEVVYLPKAGAPERFTAVDDITIYHKVARRSIAKGAKVSKYGEHIGEALCDIGVGSHVHEHNVEGVRENLDI